MGPLAAGSTHLPRGRSRRSSKLKQLVAVGLVLSTLSLLLLAMVYRSPRLHPPPPPDPGREKLPLVAVTGTNTLLLSAYLDLRNSWQEVRVISVVLRSEQAAYRCLLCCQGQLQITAGYAHVHEDHFGFDYGAADIFCFLPAECPDPSHVALSVAATPPAAEEGEEPRFLEVQNRKPIRDNFAHNFTVCLSTMFTLSNVLQLVQSMEMLRLLGVSRVVVYKTSCSTDTQKLLDHYEHTGFMEVIPWTVSRRLQVSRGWRPEVSPGQLHYHGQILALNDCVYRYMYRTHYLGLHDMDELILPQTVDSWNEMLPLLESLHGAGRGFMFENVVFPTSVSRAPPPSSPSPSPAPWQQVEGVDILQHLHHEPPDALTFTNFKVVVDPRVVLEASVHGLQGALHASAQVSGEVARMYHTRGPVKAGLKPEELTFDGRLLAYRTRLVPAVLAVLKETGLLPPDPAAPRPT